MKKRSLFKLLLAYLPLFIIWFLVVQLLKDNLLYRGAYDIWHSLYMFYGFLMFYGLIFVLGFIIYLAFLVWYNLGLSKKFKKPFVKILFIILLVEIITIPTFASIWVGKTQADKSSNSQIIKSQNSDLNIELLSMKVLKREAEGIKIPAEGDVNFRIKINNLSPEQPVYFLKVSSNGRYIYDGEKRNEDFRYGKIKIVRDGTSWKYELGDYSAQVSDLMQVGDTIEANSNFVTANDFENPNIKFESYFLRFEIFTGQNCDEQLNGADCIKISSQDFDIKYPK